MIVRVWCYLLEFSVGPGGSRQDDVHAAADLGTLRASFEERYDEDHLAYLTLWYGAVLHLYFLEDGVLTHGIDLHPYLRTGDERYDATVRGVLGGGRAWDLFDRICEATEHDCLEAVRAAAHYLSLGDDDRAGLDAAFDEAELPPIPGPPCRLTLDWAAIGAVVPALGGTPPKFGDTFTVTWTGGATRPANSSLEGGEELRMGLNDRE